jgi:hypothetical protein
MGKYDIGEEPPCYQPVVYKMDIANGKGTKNDKDKVRLDLIEPEFIEGLGKVLTMGAKKYSDNNWQNNLETKRIFAALFRHLIAYRKGEKIDPESGLPHLYHMACNLMFLDYYDRKEADAVKKKEV